MIKEKVNLTVKMNVTIPQALALKAMFNYWNQCGNWGMTRQVGFYVDGDGNFQPKCEVTCDKEIPELTEELAKLAISIDSQGDRLYDFDSIACEIEKD